MNKKEQEKYVKYALFGGGLVLGFSILKSVKSAAHSVVFKAKDNAVQNQHSTDDKTFLAIADICQNINDAISFWGDDEDKIIRNLNGLKTPYQVGVACDLYRERYGKGLKSAVEDAFNDGIAGIPLLGSAGVAYNMAKINNVVKLNWK